MANTESKINSGECLIRCIILAISAVPLIFLVFTTDLVPFLLSTISINCSGGYDLYSQLNTSISFLKKPMKVILISTVVIVAITIGLIFYITSGLVLWEWLKNGLLLLIILNTLSFIAIAVLQFWNADAINTYKQEGGV